MVAVVMRWPLIISLLSSSSLLSLSSDISSFNSSASLNSGTRKLFFAGLDGHENIDDGYPSHVRAGPRYYNQDQDDLLPFGNFGELNNSGKEEAKITIQQFIDKLKLIRKQRQLEKKLKKMPNRTDRTKQIPELKTIPDVERKSPVKKSSTSKSLKKQKQKPSLSPQKQIKVNPPKRKKESIHLVKSKPSPSPVFKKKTKEKQGSPTLSAVRPPAKKKQPKFSAPKLKKTPIKKDDIFDDFFGSGGAIHHSDHHVHQHDHLHAHKALHKHKETHSHDHAHSNDHVHSHKHTHNHVHNHIHKHNEQHEHDAEHHHTEKHHHKHIEYVESGWKKRSDQTPDDDLIARSDQAPPSFEPFVADAPVDKLEERSGEVITEQKDAENNLKNYLRKYIEFYKSVTDSDTKSSSDLGIDRADERNDRGDETMGMTNEKNTFPDKTFVLDGDNDYNHGAPHSFYHQEGGEQYKTEILPNYEKHSDGHEDQEFGITSFDAYMSALSEQFPEFDDDVDLLEPDYEEERFLSLSNVGEQSRHYEDTRERGGQWEPVLQDIQIAFYDLEPDWQPQDFIEIERKFSTDANKNS